jgi:hypothetical protein
MVEHGKDCICHNCLPGSGILREKEDAIQFRKIRDLKHLYKTSDFFIKVMKLRLKEKTNQGYQGWDKPSTKEQICCELVKDAKLLKEVDYYQRARLCVDIANKAMMFYFLNSKEWRDIKKKLKNKGEANV